MLASGVFLTESEVKLALARLESKKNLILQGPRGVGKNFIARKLAYALMEEMDDGRIEMIQFHQSYSYEDFIRGYRPLPEKADLSDCKMVYSTTSASAQKKIRTAHTSLLSMRSTEATLARYLVSC
jgi:MoxR-like ATPase